MSEQYPISTASRAAVETIIERAMTKCKENKQRALNNNPIPETANAVSSNEIFQRLLKRAQSNLRDPPLLSTVVGGLILLAYDGSVPRPDLL